MILSPHEIAWLVKREWPDLDQQRIAVAVFLAESGGNTEAIARSTEGDNAGQRDHGLTQVSGRWHGDKLLINPDWRDPEVNVAIARLIWEERKRAGKPPWSAWSVFNSGAYEKYLPDADFALAAPFRPPPRPASGPQVEELAAMVVKLSTAVDGLTAQLDEIRRHFA